MTYRFGALFTGIFFFGFSALCVVPIVHGDESGSIVDQEEVIINKLHRIIDRGLVEEFKENGIASITGSIAASVVGVTWEGLSNALTGGFDLDEGNPLFIDFSGKAFLTGAAMGTLAVVSRTYLKTPFDWLSRPLTWAVYKRYQIYDWVFYEKPEIALNERYSEFLDPVAERLMSVVERVFDIPQHYWTITTMDSTAPSVFSTSGYNIAVYHSFFPLVKNQAGMACVLGHEMGHVLAKHTGQKLSDVLFMKKYTLSSVPFSSAIAQNHETQADEIGIYLTALAGYDPTECSKVWERMTVFAGERREFINILVSTHPTNATRNRALKDHGEKLQDYYTNRMIQLGLGIDFVL